MDNPTLATTTENLPRQWDWLAYYDVMTDRPPRETLLTALNLRPSFIGLAVDLGCGEGRDTVELLKRGWQVLAIDAEMEGINRLNRRITNAPNLTTLVSKFEDLELPTNIDLVNASFSLFFCSQSAFPQIWSNIGQSLATGGIFCGQLLGKQDTWAIQAQINSHQYSDVVELLEPFTVIMLKEESYPGITALGEEKHWHLFHIIAQKK